MVQPHSETAMTPQAREGAVASLEEVTLGTVFQGSVGFI